METPSVGQASIAAPVEQKRLGLPGLGLLDLANLKTSALLLPVVPLGYWIGLRLLHELNPRAFAATLNWLLLLVGLKLLWDSVVGG